MTLTFVPTTFGLMLDYPKPADCNLAILCIDFGTGHQPITVALPHQFYRERLREILREHPGAQGFTIIPCCSADKITVPLSALKD